MGVVMAKYSIFIRPDLTQVFWGRMRSGGFISEADELIDTSRRTDRRILVNAGGVRPHREEMWVSPETIYQSLYVESRGALNREHRS